MGTERTGPVAIRNGQAQWPRRRSGTPPSIIVSKPATKYCSRAISRFCGSQSGFQVRHIHVTVRGPAVVSKSNRAVSGELHRILPMGFKFAPPGWISVTKRGLPRWCVEQLRGWLEPRDSRENAANPEKTVSQRPRKVLHLSEIGYGRSGSNANSRHIAAIYVATAIARGLGFHLWDCRA
jgi:hypothetical protein